jgi:hypothetical protein
MRHELATVYILTKAYPMMSDFLFLYMYLGEYVSYAVFDVMKIMSSANAINQQMRHVYVDRRVCRCPEARVAGG